MKKIIICISLIICITTSLGVWALAFDDTKDSWCNDYVERLTTDGAISGYSDGSFKPNGIITSAEFVTIVSRYCGLKKQNGQTNHWASGYMQTALSAGIYDWDEIPPTGEKFDKPISRQLAVKIIMKAFLPSATGDYNKWSSKISDWNSVSGRYYNAVLSAYELGIVGGYPNGTFCPNGNLTRGEACKMIVTAVDISEKTVDNTTKIEIPEENINYTRGGVSENGHLQVIGTQLCNSNGTPVVLNGMSSHGIQWYSNFADSSSIRATAEYGANVFRVAMYTAENGYISDKTLKDKVVSAVDSAVANDMYVIIDWHILSDGNPMTYINESKNFFGEMSAKYADCANVIYEICNEPNGNVSWDNDVKKYAEELIPIIREHSKDAVILVGSPTWSQDVDKAADNQLNFKNIMYTCHFYAGTHGQDLRNKIDYALKKGAPIFISEWGTSDASGSGGFFEENSETWIKFLNDRAISRTNWSLCDKNESSAALVSGADTSDGIQDNELTPSGKFVFSKFNFNK